MKERIDVMLVKQGFFDSREKAQKAIMAGLVFSKQQRIDKPGTKIDSDAEIEVKGNPLPYVGRGGLKLEKALKVFNFTVENKIMLDIGSSTGGFTDCALQNGAKLVYALDVGYNQLAWKLRSDERVVVMERTNFRYAKPEDFQAGLPDAATMDVSFISIKKMLPVLSNILIPNGQAVTLIKPQFEAGKEEVGKKGIVRNPSTHFQVISDILDFAASLGYEILALDFSPITGGDGNIEFLAHLEWKGASVTGRNLDDNTIQHVVEAAHAQLKK
ncbi:TlyA family RNA methyltransferase [Scopulibacillus cellulosilyticus]|uniref:TlyA family RNA methyltransferase n=1 Tax=Scopulibacillus cellulosilyticus TaxID=2665665 RepID=A0ABW2PXW4_9BACL